MRIIKQNRNKNSYKYDAYYKYIKIDKKLKKNNKKLKLIIISKKLSNFINQFLIFLWYFFFQSKKKLNIVSIKIFNLIFIKNNIKINKCFLKITFKFLFLKIINCVAFLCF